MISMQDEDDGHDRDTIHIPLDERCFGGGSV